MSFKKGSFEPYLVVRYNRVNWNFSEFSSDKKDDFIFEPHTLSEKGNYSYLQNTLGINFWFGELFAVNVNYQSFASLGSKRVKVDGSTLGLEFWWRFNRIFLFAL